MWQPPGLPHLCQISSLLLYFKSAILDARCGKVSGGLSSPIGFGDCRFLDLKGSLKLASTSHLRGGGKGFCGTSCLEVFGTDFTFNVSEEKSMFVVFLVVLMATKILNFTY